MRLTSRLFLLIQDHDFMQKGGCDFMQLQNCKKPYEVLERILLNVSAKNCISWVELLHTKQTETERFAELCVAIILIDKYLKEVFEMNEEDRNTLIGFQYSQIIDEYYGSISNI